MDSKGSDGPTHSTDDSHKDGEPQDHAKNDCVEIIHEEVKILNQNEKHVEGDSKLDGEERQEGQSDKINDGEKDKDDKLLNKNGKPEIIEYTHLEQKPRVIVKHSILGNRIPSHDQNVLVESTTFTSLGKIQPFLISISTNAALIMDFHCHLTTSEVVGYLAGNWDVNSHNLNITHAFPCKCRLGDYESAPLVENEIRKIMKANRLSLAGWYHSHPTAPATPTLRDVDTQLDYELRMKGSSDSTYMPCIGIICSPYNLDNPSFESNVVSYWVIPPPETKIHEYGKPMMMSYSVLQDQLISHEVLLEMKKCADFYKPEKDFIRFNEIFKGTTTYLDKLKVSLSSKFPLNHQKSDSIWNFVQDILSLTNEKSETEILKQIIEISSTPGTTCKPKFSVPNTPPMSYKSSPSSNSNTGTSLNYQKSHSRCKSTSSKRPSSREGKNSPSLSNYFVGSDLASVLFGSGKFPMGLDPATKSLLNFNSLSLGSMFLPPMGSYKPEPSMGLMKPPPPPSTYYPYSSPRGSASRSSTSSSASSSSSSSSSSSTISSSSSSSSSSSPSSSSTCTSTSTSTSSSSSRSRNLPSTSRDMPPPNKVPKIDVHQMANFFIPPNLGKNCTITSRPSTSTK